MIEHSFLCVNNEQPTSRISGGIFSPPSISRVRMMKVSRFILRFTFLLCASVCSNNIENAIAYAESHRKRKILVTACQS
jgi:hypothetical protein